MNNSLGIGRTTAAPTIISTRQVFDQVSIMADKLSTLDSLVSDLVNRLEQITEPNSEDACQVDPEPPLVSLAYSLSNHNDSITAITKKIHFLLTNCRL